MPSDEGVVINGNLVGFNEADGNVAPWHLSMNAISIDPTFGNVYFGTMNGRDIWSIPAAALADASQDDTLLRWADGFAFVPDSPMYIVANQMNTHPALNMETEQRPRRIPPCGCTHYRPRAQIYQHRCRSGPATDSARDDL